MINIFTKNVHTYYMASLNSNTFLFSIFIYLSALIISLFLASQGPENDSKFYYTQPILKFKNQYKSTFYQNNAFSNNNIISIENSTNSTSINSFNDKLTIDIRYNQFETADIYLIFELQILGKVNYYGNVILPINLNYRSNSQEIKVCNLEIIQNYYIVEE